MDSNIITYGDPCELTYCDGPNPAGCSQNGCGDGFECVDFGNSGYADFCVSSSCSSILRSWGPYNIAIFIEPFYQP